MGLLSDCNQKWRSKSESATQTQLGTSPLLLLGCDVTVPTGCTDCQFTQRQQGCCFYNISLCNPVSQVLALKTPCLCNWHKNGTDKTLFYHFVLNRLARNTTEVINWIIILFIILIIVLFKYKCLGPSSHQILMLCVSGWPHLPTQSLTQE